MTPVPARLIAACALIIAATAPMTSYGQAASDSSVARIAPARGTMNSSLPLVTSDELDMSRADQLLYGVADGESMLLRSASSLVPRLPLRGRLWTLDIIEPQFLMVRNSGLPFSQNTGVMWAGRGISTRTLAGFRLEVPNARLIFAPQVVLSENKYWLQRHPRYFQPVTPLAYIGRGYTFPYYFYTFPIDHPLSFGENSIRIFDPGESSLIVHGRGLEAGVSTENQWWGPGIRNAILLSNNAPGFPHAFVRTSRPIRTPLGGLELRWLVGALEESRYFDTVSVNDTRSLAALGLTLQSRWDPNLSVGVARSVYATADGWKDVALRWGDVFKGVTAANDSILDQVWEEPPLPGGRDQLFTVFARWVFPESGAEIYSEWGRTQVPKSIGAFLRSPNHTQGYTVGMQWRSNEFGPGSVRLQAELTQLEQSATFRDGPVGSWYTSSRVVQGYTHKGQVIGGAIGPGASSQFAAADYLARSWRAGAYVGRIRTNEDVHSTYGFPSYVSYCNHDVSVFPGFRGAVMHRFGTLSADLLLQNRMNVLFQNRGGCPNTGDRLDLRNASFTLKFSAGRF
jgi:hypothetical protein